MHFGRLLRFFPHFLPCLTLQEASPCLRFINLSPICKLELTLRSSTGSTIRLEHEFNSSTNLGPYSLDLTSPYNYHIQFTRRNVSIFQRQRYLCHFQGNHTPKWWSEYHQSHVHRLWILWSPGEFLFHSSPCWSLTNAQVLVITSVFSLVAVTGLLAAIAVRWS